MPASNIEPNALDSKAKPARPGAADKLLRSFVQRIERLEAEKRDLAESIKDVYAEAKGSGFDPKFLRKIIAERRRDADDIAEENAVLDTYRRALGMLTDTPLGEAALVRLVKAGAA